MLGLGFGFGFGLGTNVGSNYVSDDGKHLAPSTCGAAAALGVYDQQHVGRKEMYVSLLLRALGCLDLFSAPRGGVGVGLHDVCAPPIHVFGSILLASAAGDIAGAARGVPGAPFCFCSSVLHRWY